MKYWGEYQDPRFWEKKEAKQTPNKSRPVLGKARPLARHQGFKT